MALQYEAVPLPVRMVTDVSPSQLEPDESPYLRNVITGEIGQVRPRKGWKGRKAFYSSKAGPSDVPISSVAYNQWGMVTMLSLANASTWIRRDQAYPGTQTAGTAYHVAWTTATTPYTDAPLTGGAFQNKLMPYGQQAVTDHGVVVPGLYQVSTRPSKISYSTPVAGGSLVRFSATIPPYQQDIHTVNVQLTNGSTTATLVNAGTGLAENHASSLTGFFLRVYGGLSPAVPYNYAYYIKSHTAGTSTLLLDRPYGMGESTANVPNIGGTGATFDAFSTMDVWNAPIDVAVVNTFQDRVFGAQGWVYPRLEQYYGWYANVLQWSEPGNPEKWPALNLVVLDEDYTNPIVALHTMKDRQLILRRRGFHEQLGSDEDSYEWRLVAGHVGCVDQHAITDYNGTAVFVSERGLEAYDGYSIESLSRPDSGRGVSRTLRTLLDSSLFYQRTVSLDVIDDYIVLLVHNWADTTPDDAFAYNTKTGGWSRWGSDTAAYQPRLFADTNREHVAFGSWQAVSLDNCFTGENESTARADASDENYANQSATPNDNEPVPATIQLRDWSPAENYTVRLQEAYLDHNVHSYGRNSDGWTVEVSTDPNMSTYTTLAQQDGREISGSAVDFDKYYTDDLGASTHNLISSNITLPREAGRFRFKLTRPSTVTTAADSSKLFRLRVAYAPTRALRVDNPSY